MAAHVGAQPAAASDRHALVIGAGLAGAATCVALARRGWRTTLLDAADGPAQGASALPVGMLSPHITRAPTPLSELSEVGVADMRAQLAAQVPEGSGWQRCEVDNLGHAAGRWPAALVRPAALVQAWLEEARRRDALSTRWGVRVARLQHRAGSASAHGAPLWQALDAHGQVLAQAPVVVVAGAFDSWALLHHTAPGITQETLPLRPVRGQMSLGAWSGEPLAERPRRDNGVFVPRYQDTGLPPQWPEQVWAMGSTYTRGDAGTEIRAADHERNAHSLLALCEPAARHLQAALQQGSLLGWAQTRCASLDRLPLVGALPDLPALAHQRQQPGARRARWRLEDVPRLPGLYTLTALGSRGLTLSHWCATQLAAQIDGQTPSADLRAQLAPLDPARFAWKQARRQGTTSPALSE